MARVSTYFHFAGNAEEAFLFYKSVFQTEFLGPIVRFGDLPCQPGQSSCPAEQAGMIMNISLPILGGHVIMGNDAPASMGRRIQGNNVTLSLEPDSRAETDRLFSALKEGGTVEWAPTEMPWGAYWGSLIDRYGNEWMLSCTEKLHQPPISDRRTNHREQESPLMESRVERAPHATWSDSLKDSSSR